MDAAAAAELIRMALTTAYALKELAGMSDEQLHEELRRTAEEVRERNPAALPAA
ncbi:MAG: hypothetical protein AB1568_04675 [Thermodesulfobacteriota bacterium]